MAVAASQVWAEAGSGDDALVRALEVQTELAGAIERTLPPFVFLGGGSGICLSPDGYILTSHHVTAGRARWMARVYGTGQLYVADVVGSDPLGDLALLKIPDARDLPWARLSDLTRAKVGQPVLALGDAFKLGDLDGPPGASLGLLCALHRYQGDPREPLRGSLYADALQTDAAVNPGNSGGPLLALDGSLLGVTGQIMARFGARANSGIAYAVPADQIARFLPLLKAARGGVVQHGTLPEGLRLAWDGAGTAPASGARIESVQAKSPAAKAGFRGGDTVLRVAGQEVASPWRVLGIAQSWPENAVLAFDLLRDGKPVHLDVTLPRLVADAEKPKAGKP